MDWFSFNELFFKFVFYLLVWYILYVYINNLKKNIKDYTEKILGNIIKNIL